MKKLAFILSFLILLVFAVHTTFAEEDASPSPFRVRKERVETRIENRQEAKEERVEKREGQRKENIARYFQKMIARLKATVERLEILISRIESRLVKIAAENPGKDLSAIKTEVEKAKTALASANAKIAELESTGEGLIDTERPKETLSALREKLNAIQKDLKETHRLLVHVIGQIKGLRVGDSKNETR